MRTKTSVVDAAAAAAASTDNASVLAAFLAVHLTNHVDVSILHSLSLYFNPLESSATSNKQCGCRVRPTRYAPARL